VNGCIRILRAAIREGNFEQATIRVRNGGFQIKESTFDALLEDILSVLKLKKVATVLGLPLTPFIRFRFFNIRLRQNPRAIASFYAEAKRENLPRDWAVASPVVYFLMNGDISEPTNTRLDSALNVYRNAMRIDQEDARNGFPSRATDTNLFEYFQKTLKSLLRGLIFAKDKRKYFPIARSLLEDAKAAGYEPSSNDASSIAVMLMRAAPSHQEALDVFRQFREEEKPVLDASAYRGVLTAYCQIGKSDARELIPPAQGYFELLAYMKNDGVVMDVHNYGILITHYSSVATLIKRIPDRTTRLSLQKEFLQVTEHTYNHLMTESSVVPDTKLFSQLMDAYNRLGQFSGVVKMWNMLCTNGRLDNAAISIIFDACGYAGAYDFALEVKQKLKADGVIMNPNNWYSWIECLCRLGRIDEAIRQLVHKSPRDSQGNPDQYLLEIILTLASRAGRLEEYRIQLDKLFPELVKSLNLDASSGSVRIETVEREDVPSKRRITSNSGQRATFEESYFTSQNHVRFDSE
jgi:tetratricopeptide (TPR) repeat protein